MSPRCCVWIGGSSGLTRSYLDYVANSTDHAATNWIFLGHQNDAPRWLQTHTFLSYDLLRSPQDQWPAVLAALQSSCPEKWKDNGDNASFELCLVVGVRPPLLSYRTHRQSDGFNQLLVQGLEHLVEQLLRATTGTTRIIHISSVAAVNHLQAQCFLACDQDEVCPVHRHQNLSVTATIFQSHLHHLPAPYDRFKRACEILLDTLANGGSLVHLRLSAIFSNDESCIQCNALALQDICYCQGLTVPIDCNSSYNVAVALQQILSTPLQPTVRYYYYTRPASLGLRCRIPYGYYLNAYRHSYRTSQSSWTDSFRIPVVVTRAFVAVVHYLTKWIYWVPYIQSVDYLLQVSQYEHSFDCSPIVHDYPAIPGLEEGMEACFVRRRKLLPSYRFDFARYLHDLFVRPTETRKQR
jgi:hypothetical protein